MKRQWRTFAGVRDLGDIIQATYLNFTSEAEIRQQITRAGFTVKDINYSSRGVLPILVAVKP